MQHRAADRPADRRVGQWGGKVPVVDAVRHQRQPASLDQRRAGKALMPPGVSLSDFYYILPELVLTGGALLVLVADVLLPKQQRAALAWVTLLALAATAAALVPFVNTHVEVAHGLLAVDRFALFFKILFLLSAGLTVLMSVRYLET